jgi:hypothetical protein
MFAINKNTGRQIVSERCTGTTRGICPVTVDFDQDGKPFVDTDTSDFEDDYSYNLDVECDGYFLDSAGKECRQDDIVFVAALQHEADVPGESEEDDEEDAICDFCGIECPGGGTCAWCEEEELEESDSETDGCSCQ